MLLIKGIIMILLAILMLSSPAAAILTYVIWIGLGLIITGVVRIVEGIQAKGTLDNWGWILFEGIMDILIGFILMANPAVTASVFPFIIGFWAAFYGFFLIVDSFTGTGNGLLKIVGGILIVMLAFNIMFNPLGLGLVITIWIGIMLLVMGIYNVIASFSLK